MKNTDLRPPFGVKVAIQNPTNSPSGFLTFPMGDKAGRIAVVAQQVRELVGVQQTAIAGTAETTIITAGGAGVFNDLVALIITTANAAAASITIKDATAGTTRLVLNYPNAAAAPGAPLVIELPVPIPQAASNNNWTATISANAGGVNVTAIFAKNL